MDPVARFKSIMKLALGTLPAKKLVHMVQFILIRLPIKQSNVITVRIESNKIWNLRAFLRAQVRLYISVT